METSKERLAPLKTKPTGFGGDDTQHDARGREAGEAQVCRPFLTPLGADRLGSDTQHFAGSVYFNSSEFLWEISSTLAGSIICTLVELPPAPKN